MAKELDIHLIWLLKQCLELNGMEHFWRAVEANISANYQFAHIEEHTRYAEWYSLQPTNKEALRKAGILSKNFG